MIHTGSSSTKMGGRSQSITKSNINLKTRRNTRMPEGVPEADEQLEKTGGDFSTLSESNVKRFFPRDEFLTPQKLPSIKSNRMTIETLDYLSPQNKRRNQINSYENKL